MSLGTDIAQPMDTDVELTTLLGIPDLHRHDPQTLFNRHTGSARLRVPIAVGVDGRPVDLDIKESAQGGMGPHGMLIGATGSGKSELLRTLVLGLALTNSSETLNFILVDFKGGATFLGLEELPHTSAVITNLADEVALVERMQDALHGELIRRQELLRAAGNYTSALEYERARAAGTDLTPLPSLFVVVDEFSELLSAHREFMDLFVMIGLPAAPSGCICCWPRSAWTRAACTSSRATCRTASVCVPSPPWRAAAYSASRTPTSCPPSRAAAT